MGLIIPTRYVVYYKSGSDGDEGDVTISQNGDVTFSDNSASSSEYTCGGAIYATGGLNICNNGDVRVGTIRGLDSKIGAWPPIPKASALVFTMRAAHSSPPCIARFFTAGFSPLFTRPKAVEKLDFEFWILKLNIRLASSQFCKLELVRLSPRRQPWSSPCAQRILHHRA